MSFRERRAAILVALLVLLTAGQAAAQSARADRPFRGLFGAGTPKERGQSLSFDWSMFGAYDDNLTAGAADATVPQFVVDGMYAGATGALAYRRLAEHHAFSASGTTTARYYPDLDGFSAVEGGGGATFTSDLGRRTKFDLAQSFSFQPYFGIDFLNSVLPSGALAADIGNQSGVAQTALGSQRSTELDGRVGVSRTLGGRSSIRGDYSYRLSHYSGSAETFSWQLANIGYSRNLTRYAALRVGYGYGVGDNTDSLGLDDRPVVNHNLDLGIDYNRQLSFSRRTRVNFSTGSTAIVDAGSTKYRLIGNAGLNQEIGRTWRAEATYNRGVQYLPGFGDVLFSDTAQVHVLGLIGRRVETGAFGGYASGQVGSDRSESSYSSATAGADVRIAVSRAVSLFAQYNYYRYGFDRGVQVPFGLPARLDRQAIRFGLSGWLPLVR